MTEVEMFKNKTREVNGCWEWTGWLSKKGYGDSYYKGKKRRAHRHSYELFVGPIPKGFLVCHRCDNPKCVRPEHLFIGTYTDNMRDCSVKGRVYCPPKKTHCKSGHEFNAENTYFYAKLNLRKPQRQCRACMRLKDRRLRALEPKP